MTREELQSEMDAMFQSYASEVYRFAKRKLNDMHDAEDVVQEVFTRAMASWCTYRSDANVRTWLLCIARNHIVDVYRKRVKERDYVQSYVPPSQNDPYRRVETMLDVEASLLSLKESHRKLFVLRHIHDISVRKTARILGWTEANVRTADYRVVAKCRESMAINA